MLANLQALRALAAIGVVIFHFGTMPGTGLPFRAGGGGVDVFFVLSGFIIAYSASRDARHFLAHRFIRVVPAYWIVTILAALFPLLDMNWRDVAGWLVQSQFYLPGPHGRPAFIFVAWTLVYELAFYLLYWLALRFGARQAPIAALVLLPVLALIHIPGLPGPWPLLLEFAIGIGIYLATERLDLARRIGGRAGLLIAGVALLLMPVVPHFTGYDPDNYQGFARVLNWGLLAGCIVLGAIAAERGGFAVKNRLVLLLGAASYAIYLLHPIAVGQLLRLPPNAPPLSWAVCIAATAGIVALAVAFHLWIEAPLLRRMRRLIGDKAPVEQRESCR